MESLSFSVKAWLALSTENRFFLFFFFKLHSSLYMCAVPQPSPRLPRAEGAARQPRSRSSTGGAGSSRTCRRDDSGKREPSRGLCRDRGHCDISLSTFGVSSANGQGWAQDAVLAQVKGDDLQVSPLGVRNNGMWQPRPGGKAENGTGGSSR